MIAKCCDWSIVATGFAAFLLADSKYVQLVDCESTIKGLASAYSPIVHLARSAQVVHLVEIADFGKAFWTKSHTEFCCETFLCFSKNHTKCNCKLLQMREKSMVMCRSLTVWFVRKQCDLQIYLTKWILRHPKDDLLDGKSLRIEFVQGKKFIKLLYSDLWWEKGCFTGQCRGLFGQSAEA